MTDKNAKLYAAYLFWEKTRCWFSANVSAEIYTLLDDFNACMDRTGLEARLGRDAFELMLESSGYEKYEDDEYTYWRGIATVLEPHEVTENQRPYPKFFE